VTFTTVVLTSWSS